MQKRNLATLAVTLLLVAVVLLNRNLERSAWAQSGGSYDLEWHVIASAGDQFLANGNYRLGFSLGQAHEPGLSSGGSYQMLQGYWAGSGFHPTAVRLADLHVETQGNALLVCWETTTEVDNLGFHIYRSETGQPGTYSRLNQTLILSRNPGSPQGAVYTWRDTDVTPQRTYYYLLEDVDLSGQVTQHGPVRGTLTQATIHLPLVVKGQ